MKTEQITEHLSKGIEVMKKIKEMNLEENRMVDEFLEQLIKDLEEAEKKGQEEKGEAEEGEEPAKPEEDEDAKSAEKLRKMVEEAFESATGESAEEMLEPIEVEDAGPEEIKAMGGVGATPPTKGKVKTEETPEPIKEANPGKLWCAVCEEFHDKEEAEKHNF